MRKPSLMQGIAQTSPPTRLRPASSGRKPKRSRNTTSYLAHEYLKDTNQPIYFHQFAAAAQRHGLQYLAEADITSMLLSNFPPQVAETLRRIGPDIVRIEQYMDFVRSRMFRQTLLVHQAVPVQRKLDAQVLKGFHVATLAQPDNAPVSLVAGDTVTFRAPHGATLTTGSPVTKAAMLCLADQSAAGFRVRGSPGGVAGATADDDQRMPPMPARRRATRPSSRTK